MSRGVFQVKASPAGAKNIDRILALQGLSGKEGKALEAALEHILDLDESPRTEGIFTNRESALMIWPAAFAAHDAGNIDLFTRVSSMLLRTGHFHDLISPAKVYPHRATLIKYGSTTLPDPARNNARMDRVQAEMPGLIPGRR